MSLHPTWMVGRPGNEVPGSLLKKGESFKLGTSFPVGGESLGMRLVPGHISILHFTSLL